MYMFAVRCCVCLLIGLVVILTVGNADDEEAPPVFVPTSEWQQIAPGQSIPAGLHVRMSLQTGLKEAKLMEDTSGDQRRADYHGYSDRRGVVNKRSKAFTLEEYMSMLQETPEQSSSQPPALTHLTTHPEHTHSTLIDKTLNFDPPVTLHKEAVTILELIRSLGDSETLPSKLVGLLDDLEYHVHEIDNGRDLVGVGGVPVLLRLLNCTQSDVRSHAALVLGSAAQRYGGITVLSRNTHSYYSTVAQIDLTQRRFDMRARITTSQWLPITSGNP